MSEQPPPPCPAQPCHPNFRGHELRRNPKENGTFGTRVFTRVLFLGATTCLLLPHLPHRQNGNHPKVHRRTPELSSVVTNAQLRDKRATMFTHTVTTPVKMVCWLAEVGELLSENVLRFLENFFKCPRLGPRFHPERFLFVTSQAFIPRKSPQVPHRRGSPGRTHAPWLQGEVRAPSSARMVTGLHQ